LLLLAAAPGARARVNIVTLPSRDTLQLTIYNSADLTLVKETRVLTFRKGLNRLEFSWANTLIDPTSVEFRALSHADAGDVLDVRRDFAGDWALKTDASYEKVDANKVKFVLPLKAREKRHFSYDLATNFESNATQ
jgi:hypothetical protein